MTLYEYVNIGHPGVAWELGRRARASVNPHDATAAVASFGERVAASTGAGGDR
jgi:hypothetical protein